MQYAELHGAMTRRQIAMAFGIAGAVIGFVINALYSAIHLIHQIIGFSQDETHFLLGIIAAIAGLAGSLLVLRFAQLGAGVLVGATVVLFVAVGWWAFLAAPFSLIGALIGFLSENRAQASHSEVNEYTPPDTA